MDLQQLYQNRSLDHVHNMMFEYKFHEFHRSNLGRSIIKQLIMDNDDPVLLKKYLDIEWSEIDNGCINPNDRQHWNKEFGITLCEFAKFCSIRRFLIEYIQNSKIQLVVYLLTNIETLIGVSYLQLQLLL